MYDQISFEDRHLLVGEAIVMLLERPERTTLWDVMITALHYCTGPEDLDRLLGEMGMSCAGLQSTFQATSAFEKDLLRLHEALAEQPVVSLKTVSRAVTALAEQYSVPVDSVFGTFVFTEGE